MTATIIPHPALFSGDARIRLANMRLMNAMTAVQENMEKFLKDKDWDTRMDEIYQQACKAEDASIRLLNEPREPHDAA